MTLVPETVSKHVLVIANGEFPSEELFWSLMSPPKTLIAVDGGLVFCERVGHAPDLITGDFDSAPKHLLRVYEKVPTLPTPDQDKTDLEKALEYLLTFPIEKITVLGALGRRVDHTLANIYLLSRYPEKICFETEEEICFALPKKATLSCTIGQRLSLIPLGEVDGLTSMGLKWELEKQRLDKNALGISNECKEDNVAITFEKGDLILCLEKNM